MLLVRFIASVNGGEPIETQQLVDGVEDVPQAMGILGANIPGIVAALENNTPMTFLITVDKILKTLPAPKGNPS